MKTKLRAKEDENQGLIKDREHLEELNSSWSKNNNDLIQEIQDLKVFNLFIYILLNLGITQGLEAVAFIAPLSWPWCPFTKCPKVWPLQN